MGAFALVSDDEAVLPPARRGERLAGPRNHEGEGSAVTEKRAFAETPAFRVLLGISGIWGAASSGYPVYTRVFGGVLGVLCAVSLAVDLAKRRRKRAADGD